MVANIEVLSVLLNYVFLFEESLCVLPESGSGRNIAIIGFMSPKAKTIIPANACPFSAALSDHPSRLTKMRIMPIIVRMTRKKIGVNSSRLLLSYLITPSIIDGIETKLALILPFSSDILF